MDYFIPYKNEGGIIVDWDFQSIIHCVSWYNDRGYANTLTPRPNRKHIKMHRLLLGFPDNDTDHINGIRNDNRLSNLREATRKENALNRKCHRDGFSYHVTFDKQINKYRLYRFANGRDTYVGLFNSRQEAYDRGGRD